MKEKLLLLFIFVSQLNYGQQRIQITLQEGNFTGNPSNISGEYVITDSNLIQILNNYNVNIDSTVMASCSTQFVVTGFVTSSTSVSNLLDELNAYDAVVLDAQIENEFGLLNNSIQIDLVDSNITNFLSVQNSIVETNSSELNAIFQAFMVFDYSNNQIRCNCNVESLKSALQNLPSIVADVLDNYCGYVGLLSTAEFKFDVSEVYPNPFQTIFEIEADETIINFELFNVAGKKIIDTQNKNHLDFTTAKLNSGMYFLKLTFENGKSDKVKLIKS